MKYRFSQRGAAAVEFALIAPLLFVLLFGIIEFGAVLYNKAVIGNASREAARYSATFYTNPANATATRPTCGDIQNYVINHVNTYFLNFKNSTPFGTSNVSCPIGAYPYNNYGGYAGYVDTIRIQYQYNFLVFGGLINLLSGGSWSPSLTLTAQTAMRDENQGP
jgi:Flp pilus assembly protein TadG